MKKISLFLIYLGVLCSFSYANGSKISLKEEAKKYREEGYRLQSSGNLKGAITYYTKAISIYPDYPEVYNDLGVAFDSLGEKDKAIEMYKRAIEKAPNYLPPYANLALLYEERKDIDNAIYYWKKRFSLGEEGEYWWEKAKEHLIALGAFSDVKKEWLKEKVKPLYEDIEGKKNKNTEEARKHFKLGVDLYKSNNYDGALREFESVLSLQPNDKALKAETMQYLVTLKKIAEKNNIRSHIEKALVYLDNNDYNSTAQKLKDALSTIFSIQN
ncbi:MAG: tetratricopeptide repeat protein [Candidatus Omnitrophica bacterium]|nr:tetratricopeptide repeat protein [Candidatus Omnitrophota bacterium]MCM8826321.1 tetratricopeptide repeat protein [Candidatus Omnitrophota bacterium]